MTTRTTHTASSWLCHDVLVRLCPKSHSSVFAMAEAYIDHDGTVDDKDDDKDNDARWNDNSLIKI